MSLGYKCNTLCFIMRFMLMRLVVCFISQEEKDRWSRRSSLQETEERRWKAGAETEGMSCFWY